MVSTKNLVIFKRKDSLSPRLSLLITHTGFERRGICFGGHLCTSKEKAYLFLAFRGSAAFSEKTQHKEHATVAFSVHLPPFISHCGLVSASFIAVAAQSCPYLLQYKLSRNGLFGLILNQR